MNGINFYHPNVCHVCKQTAHEAALKRCSQCQLIAYCSPNHQKIDWKKHKKFCSVVSTVIACKEKILESGAMSQSKFRSSVMILCEMALKRPLTHIETSLIHFHKCCSVCDSRLDLKDCQQCLTISFCAEHEHSMGLHLLEDCLQLKLCLEAHLFKADESNVFPAFEIRLKTKYFSNMADFIAQNVELETENELSKVLISDYLTRPLTALYALKILQIPRVPNSRLKLHVLGAINFELESSHHWRFLLEILPLGQLELTFIGPEVDDFSSKKLGGLLITAHRVLYHEFVGECPDAVVVFNCGLHEFEDSADDTWAQSLGRVMGLRVPIILTSYTVAEAVQDVARLQTHDSSRRVRQMANPFRSASPLRDVESLGVYFVNNVLTIFPVS